MPAMATLEIGQLAPEFKLKGRRGQPVTLSEFRGNQNVLLAFFPLAFSPVCSHQLPSIQKDLHQFEALNTAVFGVSVDSHYSNTAFATQLGLTFTLLSDFKRVASEAYGVLIEEKGYSGRALFAIDREGRLVHKDLSADIDDIPDHSRVLDALRASD